MSSLDQIYSPNSHWGKSKFKIPKTISIPTFELHLDSRAKMIFGFHFDLKLRK